MSKVNVTIGVDNRVVPSGGNQGQVLTKASNDDYDLAWSDGGGGGGGGSITPAVGPSPHDVDGGATGQNDNYAREDHAHELNIDDSVAPVMNGNAASAGTSDYYARRDHVHQHDDYKDGFVLYSSVNIFPNVASLPAAGTEGRIAFVKI